MRRRDPLRRTGRLLASSLTAVALWAGPAAASHAASCPPGQGARALVVSTLCLINKTRAEHGAPRLRLDRRLVQAAQGHSRDMVAHHYFSHTSRSGLSSSARIASTGWMRGRRRWKVGENLAWQAGPPSARWVVSAWLRSPPHRQVLLDRSFQVIGLGITRGTPTSGASSGATYTADFGS
jgi:uncharacterized protein YkwD